MMNHFHRSVLFWSICNPRSRIRGLTIDNHRKCSLFFVLRFLFFVCLLNRMIQLLVGTSLQKPFQPDDTIFCLNFLREIFEIFEIWNVSERTIELPVLLSVSTPYACTSHILHNSNAYLCDLIHRLYLYDLRSRRKVNYLGCRHLPHSTCF